MQERAALLIKCKGCTLPNYFFQLVKTKLLNLNLNFLVCRMDKLPGPTSGTVMRNRKHVQDSASRMLLHCDVHILGGQGLGSRYSEQSNLFDYEWPTLSGK